MYIRCFRYCDVTKHIFIGLCDYARFSVDEVHITSNDNKNVSNT